MKMTEKGVKPKIIWRGPTERRRQADDRTSHESYKSLQRQGSTEKQNQKI